MPSTTLTVAVTTAAEKAEILGRERVKINKSGTGTRLLFCLCPASLVSPGGSSHINSVVMQYNLEHKLQKVRLYTGVDLPSE